MNEFVQRTITESEKKRKLKHINSRLPTCVLLPEADLLFTPKWHQIWRKSRTLSVSSQTTRRLCEVDETSLNFWFGY